MVLHGGGGVDGCQRAPDIDHELVVEAPVVQVMANSPHPLAQTLYNRFLESNQINVKKQVRN